MTDAPRQSDDHDSLELPEALIDDLRTTVGPLDTVPGEADARILAMGRRKLGRHRRLRLVASVATLSAAAAAVALVLLLPRLGTIDAPGSEDGESPMAMQQTAPADDAVLLAALPEDIDASGRVDILDAYALARHVESDRPYRARWDLDADGDLDQQDIDTVARRAVRLTPEEVTP